MAHSTVVISAAARARQSAERAHRIRVWIAGLSALIFCAALGIYGFDYYRLPRELRPFSDKHELLRPSGRIGINLGILGTALFCIIFLYALRKVIPWLGRIGTAKHWMDFHIICGVSAPIIIAFHASFKFNNIAGVAFWIMLSVALSGIAGRYLYAQIPQSLNAAKTSFQELAANEDELSQALQFQPIYSAEKLARIFALPTAEEVRKRSMVRRKASLSKRILFLDRAERVFHLWHVIHRPFSYAFAVLAIFHIVNAVRLGYF
jgi:hypothetical protein